MKFSTGLYSGVATFDSNATPSTGVTRDSDGQSEFTTVTTEFLDVTGQITKPISTVTSTYTIGEDDSTILADATSAALAVNLPPASANAGRILTVKKIDSVTGHAVTITPNGTDTLDGASTKVITTQWQVVTVQAEGSVWYVIGN